jgi:hypothetical protein
MKVYDGSTWVAAYVSAAGVLLAANNLSDLTNAATARTNLGVAIGTNVQAWDADLDTWSTKTAPSGTVVGTSDSQTLTNKTLTSPTINGSVATTGLNFDSNTLVIDATNNRVGVGVASPTQALSVLGNILGRTGSAANTNSDFRLLAGAYTGNAGTIVTYDGVSGSNTINYGGGTVQGEPATTHIFLTGTSGSLGSGTERMRLDASGNLGIGITSPAARLVSAGSSSTVYKALILRNADGTDGSSATIDFETSSGTSGSEAAMAGRVAGLRTGSGTSGALTFSTTNAGVLGERMRITSTGNVGIGTSSPSVRLAVADTNPAIQVNAASTGYAWTRYNSTSTNFFVGMDDSTGSQFGAGNYARVVWGQGAYPLVFGTNGTERMRLDSSGNLGLGVTPSAWGSIIKPLEFANSAYVGGQTNSTPAFYAGANAFYNGTNWIYKTTNPATNYITSTGQHQWYNAPSGTAGNAITFTQAMTLNASGQLGIGTTSPNGRLDVAGVQNANLISLSDTSAIRWSWYLNSNALRLYNYATSSDALTVDASGNLGIGTSSPQNNSTFTTLTVDGTNSIIEMRRSGSRAGRFYVDSTGTTVGAYTATPLMFITNDTERMRIDSSGNLLVGTTSANFNSSGRGLLEVNGSTNALIALKANNSALVYFHNTGTDLNIQNNSNGSLLLATNSAERFRIGASGQLGIGGANYGTSGQVLTSGGSGAAPSWANAGGPVKAWVNFNGTGTVAIRASLNVSSITDHNSGEYTVNFTTSLADANYAVTGSTRRSDTSQTDITFSIPQYGYNLTTSGFRCIVDSGASNPPGIDSDYVMLAVFR